MTGCCHRDGETGAIAEAFRAAREELAKRGLRDGGIELMLGYSRAADEMAAQVAAACGIGDGGPAGGSLPLAIAAVGGYGRRETAPYSDVDVAFVVCGEPSAESDAAVKRAFRMLTDICEAAGVKVGYSYRTPEGVEELDLESRTALMDARLVAGSRQALAEFEAALAASTRQAEFVIGHLRLRKRGRAPGDTPYAAEPDVKEGAGGLRDLQAARWISRAAFGAPADEVWSALRSRGILRDSDIAEAGEALEFLSRVRCALHLEAGRALEVLGAERQEAVAAALGFDSPGDLMARYYSHAARVARIYGEAADACLDESLAIEPGISAAGGKLFITDPGLLGRDSAAWVRVFEHAESYGLRLSRQARRALEDAGGSLSLSRDAAAAFLGAISRVGASAVLRNMARLGVLQAAVPRFDELMRLVPADTAHLFTVGEHSLRTVEQMEELARESAEQFAEALANVPDYAALTLAALTHDIGKLDPGQDHCAAGAAAAADIARSLGMTAEAAASVEFLVRNHLKMSEAARLRDLSRKRTVADFAALVGTRANLDMLFVLTAADSRAVGTKNWNAVHNRFLLELYERARAALSRPDVNLADVERHKKRVRRELSPAKLPPEEVEEHCESMPASYLLNTPPDELAAHIGWVRSVRAGSPVVEVSDDRLGRFSCVAVAAADRPGLLSDITGVLFALGVDIHAAQIHTRQSSDRIALDVLYVDFERAVLSETLKRQVESDLGDVLSGRTSARELLARRRADAAGAVPEARVTAHAAEGDLETVVEIRAPDCPGLLHSITCLISGLGFNIHSARVSTWGKEAQDTFYITNAGGGPLTAGEIESLALSLSRGRVE